MSAAKAKLVRINWTLAAGEPTAIQSDQFLCAPTIGMIVCTIAAPNAMMRARWPSSAIMGAFLLWIHKLNRLERLESVAQAADLTGEDVESLRNDAQTYGDLAENLAENVIGVMSIPLGVATNLIVDGEDVLVAMATEESSVIAAVCNGAKACRSTGGVITQSGDPLMIAQIQIMDLPEGSGVASETLSCATWALISSCI